MGILLSGVSEVYTNILSPLHLFVILSLTVEDKVQHYSRLQAVQCQKQVMITTRGKKLQNYVKNLEKYWRMVTLGGNWERQ